MKKACLHCTFEYSPVVWSRETTHGDQKAARTIDENFYNYFLKTNTIYISKLYMSRGLKSVSELVR